MITYALDFESYYDNDCSIKTLGHRGYFSHPDFDAYMVTVAGDNGLRYAGHPKDFDWTQLEGGTVVMHNASFDESLYLFGVEQGWYPKVNFDCHCTADMCAALGYPRSLKNASAAVLDVEVSKDTRDNMKGKKWNSMSEAFREEVKVYAIKDAELCLELWLKLSEQWPEFEREVSKLNRKIGQRGLPIDSSLLNKNLAHIQVELFEAENSIPWIGEYTPLSRKAFNAQCRKQGITPPTSIAQNNDEADKWFAKYLAECPWAKSVQNFRRINSFLRKLEAFDNGTMADGRYYGGLMYFGANPTGRFSGSGGNLNLQNMPRDEMFGVNFRSMIKPKEGYKLIVADLSQIEVRTLCYLSNDTKALDLIRESDDIYHAFGVLLGLHDPANGPLKDYDSALRHKVKSIVLGCFEPDTLVLTESGWKPIVYLEPHDRVWDGVEWVEHKGVICQGQQQTIRSHGIGATADHGILVEDGWREWHEVTTDPTLMRSATLSATLPSLSGLTTKGHGTLKCSVDADGWVSWTDTTSSPAELHGAAFVQSKSQPKQTEKTADTKSSCGTTTVVIDQITSDSYLGQRTCKTEEQYRDCKQESQNSKRKSLVYDVSCAGPRSRFTILTDAGPLLVHNCGYGMGAPKFASFSGMTQDEAAIAVRTYRNRMKTVVRFWRELEKDMQLAHSLNTPLEIALPSGRELKYGNIKRMKEAGSMNRFRYLGKIVRNGQLRDFGLYGGILAENLSQALARDIFSDMMLRVEKAGIEIILHVHDEIVCEVPESMVESCLSKVLDIMHTPPDWIKGIPVAAKGDIMDFYAK